MCLTIWLRWHGESFRKPAYGSSKRPHQTGVGIPNIWLCRIIGLLSVIRHYQEVVLWVKRKVGESLEEGLVSGFLRFQYV